MLIWVRSAPSCLRPILRVDAAKEKLSYLCQRVPMYLSLTTQVPVTGTKAITTKLSYHLKEYC